MRKSLSQTLSGLHTAIQGICELRNQCGFASHGSSDARPAMESVQALLAAEAADTIVGFLYRVHRQQTISPLSSVNYKNQQEFNAYIDDVHGIVTIFRSEFRPSEVLFQMEPETYRVALSEFDGKEESGDQAEVPEGKA